MYLLFVIIVWIVLGLVLVKWKSWKEYYPTVLYYCTANLLYEFLYYNHTLWAFKAITTGSINHTMILMAFVFVIIPIAIMIYLQRFPLKLSAQAAYVTIWTFFFSIIEFLFFKMGMFVYEHGWNIWFSVLFDLGMFIMIRLHYKKPLLAVGISAGMVLAFLVLFPISFAEMK